MKRRSFFKLGGLAALGTAVTNPLAAISTEANSQTLNFKNKKAKNIIFMVSDGMSSGTLNMANLYSERIFGKTSQWLQLYKDQKVSRGLMDMASASSIVTDSAAASSSWGSGFRVKNGSINISTSGEELLPIWLKFKLKGKKAGCVTTVPITHATPAGFTVAIKSRNDQAKIAEKYLQIGYDVLLGGGDRYFAAEHRKDKKDLYQEFENQNYTIVKNKERMLNADPSKKLLGIFDYDALPYTIDQQQSPELMQKIPTLAEMTKTAIDQMKQHPEGFVLQVEAGKVDWAAHANDTAALIHEQLQFDEALKTVLEFAEQDTNTLVVITTDHGNANPGLIYGKYVDEHFDSLSKYKYTNEYLLNNISNNQSESQIKEFIKSTISVELNDEEAKTIAAYYNGLKKGDDGLYNYRKLPYQAFSEIQKNYNSVGWISMDHSADYVEVAMFGPGSELHKPFMKNTDIHYLLLEAAEVENDF